MPSAPASYLAFLPWHIPGQHHVLAVVSHGGGAELQALASFPEAQPAAVLADALNGVLSGQVTAEWQLAAALEAAPGPVQAAVGGLMPALAAASASDQVQARRVAGYLRGPGGGHELFPITRCPPGGCGACDGCWQDCAECGECADGGCDVCLPPAITPRTAAVLGHALAILADEAYDYVYGTGLCAGGAPGPLGAVPPCAAGQDAWFLRRYARAFDDLCGDLEAGRLPLPACTAEEIALDIAIGDAQRIQHDERELAEDMAKDCPASRFDYDWARLQDVLFQDKDYESLLDMPFPVADDEAEQWFEEFSNIAPRDPRRGFRR
jgi:hypothetical protein